MAGGAERHGILRRAAVGLMVGGIAAALGGAGIAALAPAYGALSRSLEEALHPDGDGPETRVALGPRGHDVRLSGELTAGAAARLARLLDAHPGIVRLHLTSEGGLVEEGVAVGDLVAARGLVTYVPDYCVSACTLAFVRGRERLMMEDGRIGFHAPYEPGAFGEMFAVDASAERGRYLAAGIAADFVDEALATPSRALWTPGAARLRAAGVITGTVGPDRLPDSTLDDDPTSGGARGAVLRAVGLLGALEGAAPWVIDDIAARYLDSYRREASEADGLDLIRTASARAMLAALAEAEDDTVAEFGRFLAAALAAGGEEDEEECVAVGRDGDLLRAVAILERRDSDAPGKARALLERARPGHAAAPDARPRRIARAGRERDCAGLRRGLADALGRPDAAARLRARFLGGARPARAREASAKAD
ncbi:hypothetical protein OPKNFCMD_2238 [Methylobacterium crusticola]|uniref:Uncharacterized protein n=1 Tax=Methylobacterium crusticola TaxID=1697972 RepID=A0ABQ4QY60_9HYPH|nr:hypothetical protein [Methylobacterium crusticola]GJD49507.1 hypothetical protein OPKNFCMD_2238 [Methylobacterium crusticola]